MTLKIWLEQDQQHNNRHKEQQHDLNVYFIITKALLGHVTIKVYYRLIIRIWRVQQLNVLVSPHPWFIVQLHSVQKRALTGLPSPWGYNGAWILALVEGFDVWDRVVYGGGIQDVWWVTGIELCYGERWKRRVGYGDLGHVVYIIRSGN